MSYESCNQYDKSNVYVSRIGKITSVQLEICKSGCTNNHEEIKTINKELCRQIIVGSGTPIP